MTGPPRFSAAGQGKRVSALFLVLVAVTAVVAAAWTPAVQVELRRSFTRLPTEYTELYFTDRPVLRRSGSRSAAVVAVTLLDHGAAGHEFEVRFTLTDAKGAVVSSSSTALRARPELPVAVLRRLTIPGRTTAGPYLVRVALAGRPQTLHYRIDDKEGQP